MRRARFAVSDGDSIHERASIRDALTLDLWSPESPEGEILAAQRVAQLHHVPVLLGASHLLCIGAFLWICRGSFDTVAARFALGCLIGALACDGLSFLLLKFRDRFDLRPRVTTGGLCVLVGFSIALWIFGGHAISWLPQMNDGLLLSLFIGAGITTTAVIAIASPPLAVIC